MYFQLTLHPVKMTLRVCLVLIQNLGGESCFSREPGWMHVLPPWLESSQIIGKCMDGPHTWRGSCALDIYLVPADCRAIANRNRAQVVFLADFPKLSCRSGQSSFITKALNNASSSLSLRPVQQSSIFKP